MIRQQPLNIAAATSPTIMPPKTAGFNRRAADDGRGLIAVKFRACTHRSEEDDVAHRSRKRRAAIQSGDTRDRVTHVSRIFSS